MLLTTQKITKSRQRITTKNMTDSFFSHFAFLTGSWGVGAQGPILSQSFMNVAETPGQKSITA